MTRILSKIKYEFIFLLNIIINNIKIKLQFIF